MLNVIFFLQRLTAIVSAEPFDLEKIPLGMKYCSLMLSSIEFMQSFVNDLLDLRLMKFASLELENKPFDLVSILKNIAEIFSPQIMYSNVEFLIQVQG